MGEAKARSVQKVTILKQRLATGAVIGVSHYWMTEPGQVYPKLVRSPSIGVGLEQCMPAKTADDPVPGASVLALGHGSHPLSIRSITSYGDLDDALWRLDLPTHQGEIGFLHFAIPELLLERFQDGLALGDDECSGGVLVEAMYDACAILWPDFTDRRVVSQQRVNQCSVGVTWAWVYDHTRGLIDYKEVFILVDDVERDRLRMDDGRRLLWRQSDGHFLARLHPVGRLARMTVYGHLS
jgi:hypothetical protein